jgi:hypothetical protein
VTRRDLDAAIATLARRQHGTFSRAQALALGFSDAAIQRRARSTWIRIEGGVYALPGNPPTWRRQYMAATLAVPGSAISGRAAAALHRFDGFPAGRPEITVPRGSSHHTRLARVRQSNLFEATSIDHIPVVTVAQAVVDLARHLPRPRIERVLSDLVVCDQQTLAAIQDRYVALAHSRQRGIASVRAALEAHGPGTVPPSGELEWRLDRALSLVPGLPRATRQARPPWRDAVASRVDVLVPAWRLIVEADGRRWHTRVDDFERDRERDNDAALHGYATLRFTWTQLERDARRVASTVARFGDVARAA